MTQQKDSVVRRLVVEYGHWYVYVYLTDDAGKIIEEDAFKQPFRLDRKDVADESMDCFQYVYQWILDTTVFTARSDEKPPD
jgi:hypothetical protein